MGHSTLLHCTVRKAMVDIFIYWGQNILIHHTLLILRQGYSGGAHQEQKRDRWWIYSISPLSRREGRKKQKFSTSGRDISWSHVVTLVSRCVPPCSGKLLFLFLPSLLLRGERLQSVTDPLFVPDGTTYIYNVELPWGYSCFPCRERNLERLGSVCRDSGPKLSFC